MRLLKKPQLNSFKLEAVTGFVFISPWLVGFLCFMLGPLVAVIVISFMNWDLISTPRWIGFRNYQKLLGDPLFWQSLKVTIVYGLGRVPLGILTALCTALLLNQRVRLLGFWRVVYYMPVVLPPVAISLMWMWIYNPRYGVLNGFLQTVLGIQGPSWLEDPVLVLPSLMVMAVWAAAGRNMIVYLSGLQGISNELYEAAIIDGASAWSRFWKITLPMLTPVIFFHLVTGMIETFQLFTQAYVMTEGGPNNASLFFNYYLYQKAFQQYQMGYAAAMSWVVFIIIVALTLLIFRSSKAWVYYEAEVK
ncbi:ABC-type transporter, integral membrane subunit [Spirochaeta thermophila DSM 6578]|uniref:ABC-type transporter, integral membrane subunit n=1 Tax=Winmispira thermophila (strain ATCC 700085 / DSM 6578 / Z-1203) TaxID=869211 RepID=G0GBZ4_WINT7|nr:sugar ABC transporter permease [Spirochaeta thermophila]AEJ62005.1 ABC-type transporter, integral membrane subunit [Spirochaeta thermophila DSM 6578]